MNDLVSLVLNFAYRRRVKLSLQFTCSSIVACGLVMCSFQELQIKSVCVITYTYMCSSSCFSSLMWAPSHVICTCISLLQYCTHCHLCSSVWLDGWVGAYLHSASNTNNLFFFSIRILLLATMAWVGKAALLCRYPSEIIYTLQLCMEWCKLYACVSSHTYCVFLN